MPAIVDPNRVKCTFPDCDRHFGTEKEMKAHKKHDDDHDYCHKCDEDFDSYDDLAQHKIYRPDMHNKACRVCGQEFKSESGLKRHIELNHKIDQKLTCIGCQKSFYRACLFIEHLEFDNCDVISASQFQGHVVHKHLVTALLKDENAYARFQAKQAKFEAAHGDFEEEGGVGLDDPLGEDKDIEGVKFAALQPEVSYTPPLPDAAMPYPPLPSQARASRLNIIDVSSSIGASSKLFPNAKPTPATHEFSIAAHDQQMEQQHGVNIMKTRFWDPQSPDWNPERFYDSVISKYNCPFVCEVTSESPAELSQHINKDHRLTRQKCPSCLKYFQSATALMSHCESRGAKCQINKADNFNIFLDRLSGGFLGVNEKVRPDHLNNPTLMITDPDTGRIERYKPPVASYLQYMVTKPPDWKEPPKTGVQIGFAMQ